MNTTEGTIHVMRALTCVWSDTCMNVGSLGKAIWTKQDAINSSAVTMSH